MGKLDERKLENVSGGDEYALLKNGVLCRNRSRDDGLYGSLDDIKKAVSSSGEGRKSFSVYEVLPGEIDGKTRGLRMQYNQALDKYIPIVNSVPEDLS